jgi:hypothetical protein
VAVDAGEQLLEQVEQFAGALVRQVRQFDHRERIGSP